MAPGSREKLPQIDTICIDLTRSNSSRERLGKPTLYQLSYVRAAGDSKGPASIAWPSRGPNIGRAASQLCSASNQARRVTMLAPDPSSNRPLWRFIISALMPIWPLPKDVRRPPDRREPTGHGRLPRHGVAVAVSWQRGPTERLGARRASLSRDPQMDDEFTREGRSLPP